MKKTTAARRRQRDRKGLALGAGAVAAMLLLASLFLWFASPTANVGAGEARIGGPFSLIDDRGHPVTDHSFPGKYLLVYFGYTDCPDICPATLNTLAASLGRIGRKADLVQPLFITIDPEHDTPAKLRSYVGAFSPRLIGLSGAPVELNKIADSYRVVHDVHGDRRIDHSAVLYLIAPDGSFVAPIPADASEMVMARAIDRNVS